MPSPYVREGGEEGQEDGRSEEVHCADVTLEVQAVEDRLRKGVSTSRFWENMLTYSNMDLCGRDN